MNNLTSKEYLNSYQTRLLNKPMLDLKEGDRLTKLTREYMKTAGELEPSVSHYATEVEVVYSGFNGEFIILEVKDELSEEQSTYVINESGFAKKIIDEGYVMDSFILSAKPSESYLRMKMNKAHVQSKKTFLFKECYLAFLFRSNNGLIKDNVNNLEMSALEYISESSTIKYFIDSFLELDVLNNSDDYIKLLTAWYMKFKNSVESSLMRAIKANPDNCIHCQGLGYYIDPNTKLIKECDCEKAIIDPFDVLFVA